MSTPQTTTVACDIAPPPRPVPKSTFATGMNSSGTWYWVPIVVPMYTCTAYGYDQIGSSIIDHNF